MAKYVFQLDKAIIHRILLIIIVFGEYLVCSGRHAAGCTWKCVVAGAVKEQENWHYSDDSIVFGRNCSHVYNDIQKSLQRNAHTSRGVSCKCFKVLSGFTVICSVDGICGKMADYMISRIPTETV